MEARLSEQTRLLEQVSACRALWVRGGWMMPLPLETLGLEPVSGTCLSPVRGPGAVEGDSRAIQGGIAAALTGGAAASDDPAALHGASGAGEGEGEMGQASPGVFHISRVCLGLHRAVMDERDGCLAAASLLSPPPPPSHSRSRSESVRTTAWHVDTRGQSSVQDSHRAPWIGPACRYYMEFICRDGLKEKILWLGDLVLSLCLFRCSPERFAGGAEVGDAKVLRGAPEAGSGVG